MRLIILGLALLFARPTLAEVHSFGILGDAGVWNYETEKIRDSMEEGNVSQLILPGDNIYFDDDYDDIWRHWSYFTKPVVAIGNHHIGYEREIAYFDMPGPYYTRNFGERIKFIVLNSDDEDTAGEQITWLRTQLEAATEDFLFIVSHHPPYTVSDYHTWDEREEFNTGMRALMREFRDKITATIFGHDHVATLLQVDGLPMIVSGASWQVRRGRDNTYTASDGSRVATRWRFNDRDPYWVRLDIDDTEGTVWLNFVRADRGVECSAQLRPRYRERSNCSER